MACCVCAAAGWFNFSDVDVEEGEPESAGNSTATLQAVRGGVSAGISQQPAMYANAGVSTHPHASCVVMWVGTAVAAAVMVGAALA
jgi:hypothetical protein